MKQFVILMVCVVVGAIGLYTYFEYYCEVEFAELRMQAESKAKGASNEEREYEPVLGIDVSKYQGDVDFGEVEKCVSFVIMRATLGIADSDDRLEEYAEAAGKTKLKIGYYHLFKFAQDGEEQARQFLNAIEGKRCDMPLAIDFEEHAGNKLNSAEAVTEAKANLRMMVDALHANGHRVMIYCNKNVHEKYVAGNFDDVYLWLAAYESLYELPDEILNRRNFILQQFTDKCRMDGITDNTVDVNLFYGTMADFEHWCW